MNRKQSSDLDYAWREVDENWNPVPWIAAGAVLMTGFVGIFAYSLLLMVGLA